MKITAELNEIITAARATAMLPEAVGDVTGAPGAINAKVHVDQLPGVSGAVKLAAKAAGAVGVTVTAELSRQMLTLVIAASARGLNVSEQVAPVLRSKLARLPDGLASVRTADGRTMVDVNLDEVARRYKVRPTSVTLGDTVEIVGSL
ncbi:MAG: hypothetical protein FWF02_10560 [Micrococcales bacterium]|nr:hypothetical protein [Micrococcales bacterium]MCL2668128.1 hypothetical protein [Micrococcales bacterium]